MSWLLWAWCRVGQCLCYAGTALSFLAMTGDDRVAAAVFAMGFLLCALVLRATMIWRRVRDPDFQN